MQRKWLRIPIGIVVALAVVIILLLVTARPAPQAEFYTLDDDRPLVIAHQGGDGIRPGDTLAAFQNAVDLDVDVLELDIHMTADGVIVIMHDETVDRTTDGTGAIPEMTLDQIRALDAGYDWSPDGGQTFPFRGEGVTVPTLEEVLEAFPDMPMNIEIKQSEPSLAAPFCALIREYDREDSVLAASFDAGALAEFRAECPEVTTSTSQNEVIMFFVMETLLLGQGYSPTATAVQVPEFRSGLHVVTPRFISAAHGRGMQVHVWTVNEVADMQRMIDLGVDGIITDYPDRLLELLGR